MSGAEEGRGESIEASENRSGESPSESLLAQNLPSEPPNCAETGLRKN